MGVVARFFVESVRSVHLSGPPLNEQGTQTGPPEQGVLVTLAAVGRKLGPNVDPEDPDAFFGYYTPSGKIEMTIRGNAGAWFRDRLGKKVAVNFSELE